MEKEVEEENKSMKHKFILISPDWLDLPGPIATNIILEHFEIVDYIRFSAVCKKWHSIQKEHRLRYSPYPPPLPLSFPWLRRSCPEYKHDGGMSILFHLPDRQKSYRIPFPKKIKRVHETLYGHGCLLFLVECNVYYQPVVCVFNPVTAVQIKLPPCSDDFSIFYSGCISSPLTDPECTIFIEDFDGNIYLYRLNDNNGWKKIGRFTEHDFGRIVFCNKKIYHMKLDRRFYVIDTLLPDPIEQMKEMDCSEINAADLQTSQFDLVNFFGEVVMVITVYDVWASLDYETIKEFHVYKADFLTNKWMRMETLGDRVLFYSLDSIFGLSAIDVGCKKNTIYSAGGLKGRGVAWRAFDVSARDWIDGPPLSLPSDYLNSRWSWFLPTLENVNVDEMI